MAHIELTEKQADGWSHFDPSIAAKTKVAILACARILCAETGSEVEILFDGEILDIVSLYDQAPCPRCGRYACDGHHPLCHTNAADPVVESELLPEGRTLD